MKTIRSVMIHTCPDFSVRYIDTEHGCIRPEVINTVVRMAEKVFRERPAVKPHLFITIVGGESLGGEGFGLYHSGMQHIAFAGLYPEGVEGLDYEHWLSELRVCVAHEMIHYEQELAGTLEASEENELETERLAYELAGVQPWNAQ